MSLDLINLVLDVIWFILAYDVVRASIRFILEMTFRTTFREKGGTHLERIVSLIDISVATILLVLLITDMVTMRSIIIPIRIIGVIVVSLYRSFIKPSINPDSTL